MGAKVEEDQDRNELEGEWLQGGGEPKIDASNGRDQEGGVKQKAGRHRY